MEDQPSATIDPSTAEPQARRIKDMVPPAKRSHDSVEQNMKDAVNSSVTIAGDGEQNTKHSEGNSMATIESPSSSATMPPPPTPTQDGVPRSMAAGPDIVAASKMGPPVLPSSSMAPPSSKLPPSAQIPASQKSAKSKKSAPIEEASNVAKPINQQLSRKRSSEQTEPEHAEDSDLDDTVSPSEPSVEMGRFDWDDLQKRYHDKMQELHEGEQRVWDDFNKLCQFFGVWAQTSQNHEVGRSFKRLKTQVALVQIHEGELEKKRLHYIKVVEAFKSALHLLGD